MHRSLHSFWSVKLMYVCAGCTDRGDGCVRGASGRAVRVCRVVIVTAVRAGEHTADGATDGVPVPDIGGGRGAHVGPGGDGRVRARVRRRPRHRRNLLRLPTRSPRRWRALLPCLLPGLPQHRRPLLQPRRWRG